jgi:hypothetical protein
MSGPKSWRNWRRSLTVEEALRLAIKALNQPRNFKTWIDHPTKPGKFLMSYELIPILEKALKDPDAPDA